MGGEGSWPRPQTQPWDQGGPWLRRDSQQSPPVSPSVPCAGQSGHPAARATTSDPGPHLLDGEVVDEVVVVLVEATVQGHAVTVEQQVLQGAHPLQPQRPLRAVRQVGVIEEHVEAKGLGPQRHRLPHATYGRLASPRPGPLAA